MATQPPAPFVEGTPPRLVKLYVRDHFAAATAGGRLARRIRRAVAGSPIGATFGTIDVEIDADRQQLRSLMSEWGIAPSRIKAVSAMLGELVARTKLNGRLLRPSPLSRVLELEGLIAGVAAKERLWATLEARSAPDSSQCASMAVMRLRAVDQGERLRQAHHLAVAGL